MLHPVGPLPPSVYWRRRIVVLAAVLAALLTLWLLSGGGSAGRPPAGSAAASTGSATATAPGSGTTPPASATLAATSPAGDPGPSGDGGSSASEPPGGDGSGGVAGTSSPATQAAVPPPCPDQALRLTVTPAQPAYPVGTLPVLALFVQNVSRTTCTRDLAASQQEVLLYRGRARLWSSNDCYPSGGRDIQALAPGERDRFGVTWSGLASRPHCAGTRTRVGPGHYTLVGRIGTLRSPPTALTLR